MMKARFQLFKAPFYFVGWLAPASGIDEVNPNGITKKKGELKFFYYFQIRRQPLDAIKFILLLPLAFPGPLHSAADRQ